MTRTYSNNQVGLSKFKINIRIFWKLYCDMQNIRFVNSHRSKRKSTKNGFCKKKVETFNKIVIKSRQSDWNRSTILHKSELFI